MQSATSSKKSKGSGRIRGLIVLLAGLFVCYVLSQVVVVEEVRTETGDYDHFQGGVPVRVTTWVSIPLLGPSFRAPIGSRTDFINPMFE